jgi:hypothetical protein
MAIQVVMKAELRKSDTEFATFGHNLGTVLQNLIFDPAFYHSIQNCLKPLRSFLAICQFRNESLP